MFAFFSKPRRNVLCSPPSLADRCVSRQSQAVGVGPARNFSQEVLSLFPARPGNHACDSTSWSGKELSRLFRFAKSIFLRQRLCAFLISLPIFAIKEVWDYYKKFKMI